METRIFLTIAILAFNLNFSFANNTNEISVNRPLTHEMINLAPVMPILADFSDVIPEPAPNSVSMIPVTPKEADFEDETTNDVNGIMLNIESPTTPKEAEFEDLNTRENNNLSETPTTPDEAYFDETI